METDKFRAIIDKDEGSSLEFKKSLSDSERISQTICAFANTAGGQIIFGIHKQGKTAIPAGIDNTDTAQRTLQNWIHNGLRPQIRFELDTADLNGQSFVVLRVDPLPLSEIASYKHTIWRRTGSANTEVSGDNLVIFLRERGMLSFEELPSPARLEDLSVEKIEKLITLRGTKPSDHKPINYSTVLESLGIATTLDKFVIKKCGPLFFAKQVSQFQTNCEVRIVEFKGKQASLESKKQDIRFSDTIPELLRKSFDVIVRIVGTASVIKDGQRQEIPAIPSDVLREALTNAVGHRDYIDPNGVLVELFEDRVQITNPGGLLPGQTLKTFADTRRHRNPIIHRLLNDSGWGEGLYFGVKLMYRQLRKVNLPDPEFQDLGGFFRVILHTARSTKKRKSADMVNERQVKALAYLEKHDKLRTKEYARIIGVSSVTAVKELNELVIQGRLRKFGKYRGVYYIKP